MKYNELIGISFSIFFNTDDRLDDLKKHGMFFTYDTSHTQLIPAYRVKVPMNSKRKLLRYLSCSYKKDDRNNRSDREDRDDIDQVFQVYLMSSCHLPLLTVSNLIGNCDPRRKIGMIINIGETSEINDTTANQVEFPLWFPFRHGNATDVQYDQTFCQDF